MGNANSHVQDGAPVTAKSECQCENSVPLQTAATKTVEDTRCYKCRLNEWHEVELRNKALVEVSIMNPLGRTPYLQADPGNDPRVRKHKARTAEGIIRHPGPA